MKAELIYKCSQCGGTEYVGNVECQEPPLTWLDQAEMPREIIWHQCWKDETQIKTKYYGICKLAGIRGTPEEKEAEDGKV